jgi:geranylgeranyl reductase
LERRHDNDKACAGGMPAKLITDFDIPDHIVEAITNHVVFVAPSKRETHIDIPVGEGIATVRRLVFDAFLRERAAAAGAEFIEAEFTDYEDRGATMTPRYKVNFKTRDGQMHSELADFLIGADGAISRVARQATGTVLRQVVARQKFITPSSGTMNSHYRNRLEVYYTSEISPDYYGWVFPRKNDISLGMGTGYDNGRLVRPCLENLHRFNLPFLEGGEITCVNAAPIPVEQNYARSAIDNILLVGDSAGFVLPALGEGIYYAMLAGRIAAEDIFQYATAGGPHPATVYPQQTKDAFEPLFQVFRQVERWAYISDFHRELFCRICEERYYTEKIFATFAMKKSKPNRNPLRKAINATRMLGTVLKIRLSGASLNTDYLRTAGIDVDAEFKAALQG